LARATLASSPLLLYIYFVFLIIKQGNEILAKS
jgi:hypothetical protein